MAAKTFDEWLEENNVELWCSEDFARLAWEAAIASMEGVQNQTNNSRIMQLPGADIVDRFIRDEYVDASINDSERTARILRNFYEYLAGQQT